MIKKRVFIIGIIFLISIFLAITISASYCCEKTKEGAWCQQIENPDDCATSNNVPTSCEQTSYCKTGTCIDSEEGICMPSSQSACTDEGGYWEDKLKDQVLQCQLGCCLYGEQTSFVTQTRCKKISSDYGVETTFQANIQNEMQCLASATPSVKGACVYEEEFQKKCKLRTKKECQNMKASKPSAEFHEGYLCSAEALGTICGKKGGTKCGDDGRVYFLDTCKEFANVYWKEKLDDENYWTYIQEPDITECNGETAKGSATCGNCIYMLGSACAPKKVGESVDYGNYICRDLDCKDYTGTEFEDRDPDYPQHQETWCADSRGAGYIYAIRNEEMDIIGMEGGDDFTKYNLPGSRYFRLMCYNGEVTVETCDDPRQEICVESEIEGTSNAVCKKNRWEDCVFQNTSEDCYDIENRDCKWIAKGYYFTDAGLRKIDTGTPQGVCAPRYQPGEDFCGLASATCVETYEVKLLEEYGNDIVLGKKKLKEILKKELNERTKDDWEFLRKNCAGGKRERAGEEHCNCIKTGEGISQWEKDVNFICSNLGDCGNKINYIDKQGKKIDLVLVPAAEGEE